MDLLGVAGDKDFWMPLSDLGEPDQDFAKWSKCVGPGFAKWIVKESPAGRRELDLGLVGASHCVPPQYFVDESHNAEVHFTGKMLDGTVFATSRENDATLMFELAREDVMEGFSLAVSSMQVGEKAVFTIPPEYAVAMSRRPATIPCNVPPNQMLRFDIELFSVTTDIRKDEGILKKIIKCGKGRCHPSDADDVLVNYSAWLEDGASVSKSEGVEFSLAEGFFCPAFAPAVQTMAKREVAVLIIKPEYGFGKRGRSSVGNEATVPPDATLYVNLQLMSWEEVSRIGENREILKKTDPRKEINSARAEPCNQAVVKGKLQDGTVFDRRGHDTEEPFEFTIDEEHVIYGVDEAVMTMHEGEVSSFTIPSQHAFGATGSSQHELAIVPPNSTVIYEIELLSISNEEELQPLSMTRDQKTEYARRKENEGDNLFNSGKYLRAYRRYCRARQIQIWKYFGEVHDELKEMLISLAFKCAECAIRLQLYEQACYWYQEVCRYDNGNPKAQQMLAQTFPKDPVEIDTVAMHRGLKVEWCDNTNPRSQMCKKGSTVMLTSDISILQPVTIPDVGAPSVLRLKQGHKTKAGDIRVPGQVVTAANDAGAVGSRSATTASKIKCGFISWLTKKR